MVSPLNFHLPSRICRAMRSTCGWLSGRLYELCSSSSAARSGDRMMVSSLRVYLRAGFGFGTGSGVGVGLGLGLGLGFDLSRTASSIAASMLPRIAELL